MLKSQVKIGTEVIYWQVLKANGEKFDPIRTIIISEPFELGHGLPVCKLQGVDGGVSIKNLDFVTEEVLNDARSKGLTLSSSLEIIEKTITPFLIKKKSEDDCYKAGYDNGMNGTSAQNACFSFFTTKEKTASWERGKAQAEIDKKNNKNG